MSSLKKGVMLVFFVLSLFALSTAVSASLPSNYYFYNIGTTPSEGYAYYDSSSRTFTIQSTGAGVNHFSDLGIHYANVSISGNASIVARLTGISGNCIAGVMLRGGIWEDDSFSRLAVSNGMLSYKRRAHVGVGLNGWNIVSCNTPIWLKITKEGFDVNTYYSYDGSNWTFAASATMTGFTDTVRLGMVVNSTDGNLATATFDNVNIQSTPHLPSEYFSRTIGTVNSFGSSQYNFNTGAFTLKSSGLGFGNGSDDIGFHCALRSISGNFSITARITNLDSQANATGGIILRGSHQYTNAPYLFIGMSRSVGNLIGSARLGYGGLYSGTYIVDPPTPMPVWLRIDRVGSLIRTYFSFDKVNWSIFWSQTLSGLSNVVYVGPAAYSGDSYTTISTTIDNVEITPIS
jgi:regulation of enolase protein 1 (concanavalin A-like superfamily)